MTIDTGYVVARSIGGIIPDVTVEETGRDDMTITQHPVEIGAAISDHAFKNPAEVTLRVGWSDSSINAGGEPGYSVNVYDQLLALQQSLELITVVTGKRLYPNMLIRSLTQVTNDRNPFALSIVAVCRQVIIVSTTSVSVPSQAVMQQPQKTAAVQPQGTVNLTPAPTVNAAAAAAAGVGAGSTAGVTP